MLTVLNYHWPLQDYHFQGHLSHDGLSSLSKTFSGFSSLPFLKCSPPTMNTLQTIKNFHSKQSCSEPTPLKPPNLPQIHTKIIMHACKMKSFNLSIYIDHIAKLSVSESFVRHQTMFLISALPGVGR